MADEQVVNKADEQALGAPEGVSNKDLSAEHSSQGSPAPAAPSNEPPKKELTAEEKAAAEKLATDEAAKPAEQTPEEKAAADKAAEDAKAKEIAESTKEYATYNDATADAVVGFLKDSGIPPVEADGWFRAAVEANDLSKVNVAAMTEKLGAAKAQLVMAGLTDYFGRMTSSVKAVTDAVFNEAGGKANFDTVAKWANAKEAADPAFATTMNEYRKMFEANPTQAKLASAELVKAYNADPKNSSLTVTRVDGQRGNNEPVFEPLSRAEYVTGLHKAHAANFGRGDPVAIKALDARRMATIKAGK